MQQQLPSRRTLLGSIGAGVLGSQIPEKAGGLAHRPDSSWVVRLGIVADPQYADKPNHGARRYNEAAKKLETAIQGINAADVDLLVNLGDAIDGQQDAQIHLHRIFGIFANSHAPAVHLVGNHCLDGGKPAFDRASGLVAYHGALRFKKWRLVLLDGNAISTRGHASTSPPYVEAKSWIDQGSVDWGGGLGSPQISWLNQQLLDAQTSREQVAILCHFPIDGSSNPENHLLWDHQDIKDVLKNHECVKAWMCGHNHQGGYGFVDGIHHITFPAICDAPENSNAWAIVDLLPNGINIQGNGTVPSRKLKI